MTIVSALSKRKRVERELDKILKTLILGKKDCVIFEEKIYAGNDGIGLSLGGPSGDVTHHIISQIKPESPASKSRLLVGDEILQVGKQVILGCNFAEVSTFLKQVKDAVSFICVR